MNKKRRLEQLYEDFNKLIDKYTNEELEKLAKTILGYLEEND